VKTYTELPAGPPGLAAALTEFGSQTDPPAGEALRIDSENV